MSRVFISYRRADSAQWAIKLHKSLWLRFGKDLVFRDVEDIKPGDDWLATIRAELAASEVFLILIGPHWIMDDAGRRRLDDPRDVLRGEVSAALASKGTVIPVMVGNAAIPAPADLPLPLRALVKRNGVNLRDAKWNVDVKALIERLRELILPTSAQISLASAIAELERRQRRYFDLLDGRQFAQALDEAQKTQAYLTQVLPLYPQDPTLKLTRGYTFKNEAMALQRLQRNDEADAALVQSEEIFRTMVAERPRDAGAWNGLGSVAAVRGDLQQALVFIDRALKILPEYQMALADREQITALLARTRAHDRMAGRA